MSVRLPASNEKAQVQAAKKLELEKKERQSIPHINQLRPQGADRDYVNGAYNCAPAVVAMLARGQGKMSHLKSDAKLINELSKDLVTRQGTTPEGVARMLGRAELPIAGDALAGQYDEAAVKQHLQQGNTLIAQVGLSDRVSKDQSAHYVLVKGMTPQGNYVVSDPMARGPYVVTPKQLRAAVHRAPPDGGLLIPVAGPGNAPATAAASTAAPGAGVAESAPPPGGAAPADKFAEGVSSARKVTQPSLPAIDPASLLKPAAAPGGSPSPAAAKPELPSLAPEEAPFVVESDILAEVSPEFRALRSSKEDASLSGSEKRNLDALDIDYGRRAAPDLEVKEQITPDDEDVNEFAQRLRDRKEKKDPEVEKLLERLESSRFNKDKQVLRWLKREDLRDPGIGKKTWIDAF